MIRTRRGALPAVLLLIAILMTACSGEKPAKEPDGSATPDVSANPSDVVIDVAELEKGAPPKIAWLEGGILHDGDRDIRLPGDEASEVAVLGKRIVLRGLTSSGDTEAQVLDRTGSITARYPNPLSRMVTNGKRNIVAWIAEDNTPMVLQTGHKKPAELSRESKGRNGDAGAVIGNDCFNGPETVEGAGCTVFFSLAFNDKSVPYLASEHGIVAPVDTKIVELLDAHESQALIGTMGVSAGKVCSRYESDDTSYETCDHILDSFSPDGKNILGYAPEITEGPATDAIHVLRARNGESRLTIRSPADTFTLWETVWEDDSHVLAVVNQDDSTWAIVRIGLDGKAELAAGPTKETESTTVFGFAVQP